MKFWIVRKAFYETLLIIANVSKILSLHVPLDKQSLPCIFEYNEKATKIKTKEINKIIAFFIKVKSNGIPGPIKASFILS
jgi:hypothetical protein